MSAPTEPASSAGRSEPDARSGSRSSSGGSWPAAVVEAVRNLLSRPLASYHLILTIAFLLTVFGLVMVLSASSVEGYSKEGSAYGLFATQVIFALLGLCGFYVMLRLPVRLLRRVAAPLIVVTTILLALVLVPGIGTLSQGARRWFVVGGLSVQPSELVKVALCVWGAHLLASRRRENASLKELLIPLLPVSILICVLIVLEPNLSTTITIAIIVGALLWFAGLPVKVFLSFAAVGTVMAVVLALVEGYRSQRVMSFLGSIDDPQGAGYQARQATFALANGGVFGVGLGQSSAKWNYLPNAHNDFIFAIIGEELGLVGGLLVVLLFAILAFIGFRIAARSVDPFLRLMTATVTVLITAQAFINIGYVVGLLPVTGIQLPLLSAGGTSTLTVLAMLGLLANAARHEPEAVAALVGGDRGRFGRWLRLPAPVPYRPSRADALRDRLDRQRPDRARRTATPPAGPSVFSRLRPGGAREQSSPSGRRSAGRSRAPRTSAVRVDYRTGYSGSRGSGDSASAASRTRGSSNRGGPDGATATTDRGRWSGSSRPWTSTGRAPGARR
ncbi:putative lipid II flippase FtsW [Gordonia sp. HNM0687]|uniref:Probable peptidoglycan glycosyltransferase FtsW n=1 Tax=Gordonia mangrovi TaxID=2665643 RepID=A0A6L7GMI4_9ACTN|nr:putative lipid II flippase FtsW [Gordonia mangrovi]MXP21120.1 putative lipid II flippase FtsW [Gordonia mangrovi]UVF78342.1 putative lipid II flippase FtsW [Gordonia mangrovi]